MLWCVSCPALADYGVSHALLVILLVSCWYPLAGSGYAMVCLSVILWVSCLLSSGLPWLALVCLVSLINSLVSKLKGIDTMTQSAYNQGVTRCQNLVPKRLNEKERKDNDLWLC